MKKFLIVLAAVVLLAVFGAAYKKTTTKVANVANVANSAATRTQLEAAYNKIRSAIVSKDQTVFEANIEPAKPGAKISPNQWQQGLIYLDALYPDLNNVKFITIVDKGEFAYYIAQTELTDPKSINVTAFKFHKTPSGWKLMATTAGQSLLKKSTSAEDEVVLQRAVDAIIAQIK